jgi:hypothetical protein
MAGIKKAAGIGNQMAGANRSGDVWLCSSKRSGKCVL